MLHSYNTLWNVYLIRASYRCKSVECDSLPPGKMLFLSKRRCFLRYRRKVFHNLVTILYQTCRIKGLLEDCPNTFFDEPLVI